MGVNRTRPLVIMSRAQHYTMHLRSHFSRDHPDFGLEHGLGWLGIVHTLHYKLAHIVPGYAIHQIKEKFGSLRFYCNAAAGAECDSETTDKVRSMISEAERQSGTTCEICGEPGTLTTDRNWCKTRCGDCLEKEDEAARTDPA